MNFPDDSIGGRFRPRGWSLTTGFPCPRNTPVRSVLLSVLIAAFVVGDFRQAAAQGDGRVPQSVLDQAEVATRAMGQQVLQGNFRITLERMYPRWKKRAAKKLQGGQVELARRLAEIPKEMARQGISMLNYEVRKPTRAHEVVLLRGEDKEGQPINMYLEWLVFVPTRAEYRVIDPKTRLPRKIETLGFQVAVNKKGTPDWYFIDGRNCSIADLRSFFPSLPRDQKLLGLPQVGGGEIRREP